MILGLRTVIYPAPDLPRAKAWYEQVLGQKPYFDEPFYVGFAVGGFGLGLIPDGKPGTNGDVALSRCAREPDLAGLQRDESGHGPVPGCAWLYFAVVVSGQAGARQGRADLELRDRACADQRGVIAGLAGENDAMAAAMATMMKPPAAG